jgi:hypothetical protein
VNTRSGSNANGRAGGFSSSTGAAGAGFHNNVTGNSGGAVRTQNGDVYAGHDGNVYKHTDSGWSKYNNGSWNSVQPPTRNTSNRPRPTTRWDRSRRRNLPHAATAWTVATISNWSRIGLAARGAGAVAVAADMAAAAAAPLADAPEAGVARFAEIHS